MVCQKSERILTAMLGFHEGNGAETGAGRWIVLADIVGDGLVRPGAALHRWGYVSALSQRPTESRGACHSPSLGQV